MKLIIEHNYIIVNDSNIMLKTENTITYQKRIAPTTWFLSTDRSDLKEFLKKNNL